MEIEANVWQKVPGTEAVELFPIITKPSIISSNCYIFTSPEAILVVDPGASAEQSKRVSEVVGEALLSAWRPVWIFLTHCHQDHSQEAGAVELPPAADVRRFAHHAGAEALERGDRNLTVAYLYPWRPVVCRARFDCKLFASAKDSPALDSASGARVELHSDSVCTAEGIELRRQCLPLGRGERLMIYHTPGHSPCSISLQLGSVLVLGDLPFAANPGLCGLDGWNHRDLMESLSKVDWLIDTAGVAVCCPGHGYCVAAPTMRKKLRLIAEEARNLVAVELWSADRIGAMKHHVDELLEEATALFTILSGRLYTASYYLSLLEEERAAERVLAAVDLDQIDRTLSEFRRFVETFNADAAPELTLILKGVQVARSLQQILEKEQVTRLLGLTLIMRAQRRLEDFLSAVRGLQFLNAEKAGDVNELIAGILRREKPEPAADAAEFLAAADDDEMFVAALTRRLAAHSPARAIAFEFMPSVGPAFANVGLERLDDILTSLIEGIAGTGVRNVRIATFQDARDVIIRISMPRGFAAAALSDRRFALYHRTLSWLGADLERREDEQAAAFVIRLPALGAA
jgi:glyoxylase-like metal-dependent hydrolase (beta-lactamase superfamily II)